MGYHKAPLKNQSFFKLQILQILYLSMSKCLEGILLSGLKFQGKTSTICGVCVERGSVIQPTSKEKGLRAIGHSMIMALGQGKLFVGFDSDYGLIFGSL